MYVWVVFKDHFLNFSIEIPFVQYKSFKPQSLKCFWTVKFYTSSQYYYYFYGLFIPYTLHSTFYVFFCENHCQHNELSKYQKWFCSQTLWENHLEFLNNKKWNHSLFVQVPRVLWMQCDRGICLSKECTKILQKRPWVMMNSILLLNLTLTINSTFLSLLLFLLMGFNDEIKVFV